MDRLYQIVDKNNWWTTPGTKSRTTRQPLGICAGRSDVRMVLARELGSGMGDVQVDLASISRNEFE